MYRDLKQYFGWDNMNREIIEYADRCLTYQRVKAEHQHPVGELRPLENSIQKWDSMSMDFIIGLPLSTSKRNVVWVKIDTNFITLMAQRNQHSCMSRKYCNCMVYQETQYLTRTRDFKLDFGKPCRKLLGINGIQQLLSLGN